jgi:hypothetical protein
LHLIYLAKWILKDFKSFFLHDTAGTVQKAENFWYYLKKLVAQEIDEHTYLEQRSLLLSFSDHSALTQQDYELLKAHGKGLFIFFRPRFYKPTFTHQTDAC